MICSYGCDQEARYYMKEVDKWCCSKNIYQCPSNRYLQKERVVATPVLTSQLCSYGCGQKANYQFKKSSKYCCSIYLQSCPKIREKNSITNKVKQAGPNNGMYGRNHTVESIEKNRLSNLKNWKDPEFVRKFWKACSVKPTSIEVKVGDILEKLFSGRYDYVGDFSLTINGKVPDFIDKYNKYIIEVFGDHWHSEEKRGKSREQQEKERIDHFRVAGYRTLIIWESELSNEEMVVDKILNFNGDLGL